MPLRRDVVDEILADKGTWLTVDQLAAEMASRGLVDDLYQRAAVHRLLKVDLRKMLRSARDADGFPLYANVVEQDEDGNPIHLYKQEEMFDLRDYEYVIANHAAAARHHMEMALRYQQRCAARFGVQIALPLTFDEPAPDRTGPAPTPV
jgi:hypothetical protein